MAPPLKKKSTAQFGTVATTKAAKKNKFGLPLGLKYPVIFSENLLNEEEEGFVRDVSNSLTSVSLNFKPRLSESHTRKITIQELDTTVVPNTANLFIVDTSIIDGTQKIYKYEGVKIDSSPPTELAEGAPKMGKFTLTFDPVKQHYIMDRKVADYRFNLVSMPGDTDPVSLSKKFSHMPFVDEKYAGLLRSPSRELSSPETSPDRKRRQRESQLAEVSVYGLPDEMSEIPPGKLSSKAEAPKTKSAEQGNAAAGKSVEPPSTPPRQRGRSSIVAVSRPRVSITVKPEAMKPESKKAEAKKTGAKKSEAKKPEIKKPELEKPEPKKPELKKTDTKKPEVKKPGVKKSEAKRPEVKKPVVKQPEAKEIDGNDNDSDSLVFDFGDEVLKPAPKPFSGLSARLGNAAPISLRSAANSANTTPHVRRYSGVSSSTDEERNTRTTAADPTFEAHADDEEELESDEDADVVIKSVEAREVSEVMTPGDEVAVESEEEEEDEDDLDDLEGAIAKAFEVGATTTQLIVVQDEEVSEEE
ncbi:MAG: hypothetical protein M1829_000119 [Trizodia sp. TS-e1964]|nr:MAG: hypothetical protein M1829_000119 [Trizodia sp. TS-e1964]